MTPEVVVTAVQLLLAQPEAADLRRINHYATERGERIEEVTYVVKVYTDTLPMTNSLGIELYVGEQLIPKYAQFSQGVYFTINDPQLLSRLQGQSIRFRRPGSEDFVTAEIPFPSSVTPTEALSDRVSTFGASSDTSLSADSLPTQAELLRE